MVKLKHFDKNWKVTDDILLPFKYRVKVAAFESFCAGVRQVHIVIGQKGGSLLDVGQTQRILE
jgi:hypothetical protein